MAPAVIVIGLCCASCTTNPRAPGWNGDIPVVAAPDPRTESFAEAILQDLREDHELAMGGELYDRVWPIFASLLAAAQIAPDGWEIYVLDAPDTADIRAVHGRRLFLWSGATDLIESEEELAGLIAVELAHELTQHTVPVTFHPATEILFGVADVATTIGLAALSQGMLAVSMPGMTRYAYIEATDLDPLDRQYTAEQERETAFGALAIGQLWSMARLVIGPSYGDRILALDTMVINALGLVVVLGIQQGVQIYFEVSLLIAMLGFVSTVALARFILRGDIIE